MLHFNQPHYPLNRRISSLLNSSCKSVLPICLFRYSRRGIGNPQENTYRQLNSYSPFEPRLGSGRLEEVLVSEAPSKPILERNPCNWSNTNSTSCIGSCLITSRRARRSGTSGFGGSSSLKGSSVFGASSMVGGSSLTNRSIIPFIHSS
jgi:hypothetical protein